MSQEDEIFVSIALTPEGKAKLLFANGTSGILRKVYVNNHFGCTHTIDFECSDGTKLNINYVPE